MRVEVRRRRSVWDVAEEMYPVDHVTSEGCRVVGYTAREDGSQNARLMVSFRCSSGHRDSALFDRARTRFACRYCRAAGTHRWQWCDEAQAEVCTLCAMESTWPGARLPCTVTPTLHSSLGLGDAGTITRSQLALLGSQPVTCSAPRGVTEATERGQRCTATVDLSSVALTLVSPHAVGDSLLLDTSRGDRGTVCRVSARVSGGQLRWVYHVRA